MQFKKFAENSIVLFDGAMGTMILQSDISEKYYYNGQLCNEYLNISAPDIIYKIHKDYLYAGSDVILTNTFGANPISLAQYGLSNKTIELNKKAVEIARSALLNMSNKFIALSIGSVAKLPAFNSISYQELYDAYYEQAVEADVDIYLIETSQDIIQAKAAINACRAVNNKYNKDIPLIVSFTIDDNQKLLTGSDIQTIVSVMNGLPVYALGFNCSIGPESMDKALSLLKKYWNKKIYISPNAANPEIINGNLVYPINSQQYALSMAKLVDRFPISIIGGCCGTNPDYIKTVKKYIENMPLPKSKKVVYKGCASSLFKTTLLEHKKRPVIVSEVANITGSILFQEKFLKKDFDAMISICKEQDKEGISFLDVSFAYPRSNEALSYEKLIPQINSSISIPIFIDSTNITAIKSALERYSGKPVINSISLEKGITYIRRILNLIKEHPACAVALTIDEKGLAYTADKKLEIAKRIYDIWVNEYGFHPEDLIIDPLTFPATTGDKSLVCASYETLKAVSLIKRNLKKVRTILGISNISFGLPIPLRPALNSIFLQAALDHGLDMAILNPVANITLESIPKKDIDICKGLIFNKDNGLENFTNHFSNHKNNSKKQKNTQSMSKILYFKILKGDKSNLEYIIESLVKEYDTNHIIDKILFPAMTSIGHDFEKGKLLLPIMLHSAEAVKYAIEILYKYMEKTDYKSKGSIILATVSDDIHDIGKNLVDIILTNNGFEVHNMGVKVPVSKIIAKAKKIKPLAIGLSGLLLRSAVLMKDYLKEIAKELPDVKIMLGGGALTKKFVEIECAPIMPDRIYYCKNAFDGLLVLNNSMTPVENSFIKIDEYKNEIDTQEKNEINITKHSIPQVKTDIIYEINPLIDDFYEYINKPFLFAHTWGYYSKQVSKIEYKKIIKDTAEKDLLNIYKYTKDNNIINPQIRYGYFKCRKNDNNIILFNKHGKKIHSLTFPLSKRIPSYTIADFIYSGSDDFDILPVQIVTLGRNPVDYCNILLSENRYKDYFTAYGFFTALTEALSEYAHNIIRKELDLNKENPTPAKILQGNYYGRRFSFGYPLCPNLEYNKIILSLLKADNADISITRSYQMNPVFSTSAFIIYNKEINKIM